MTEEIAEAIEAACSVGVQRGIAGTRLVKPDNMRARIKEFLRNVPEELSVRELLDEL